MIYYLELAAILWLLTHSAHAIVGMVVSGCNLVIATRYQQEKRQQHDEDMAELRQNHAEKLAEMRRLRGEGESWKGE